MRSIGMAIGLLAFWLRWSPFLRDCPFVTGVTVPTWRPIGRVLPTGCGGIASARRFGHGSRFPLLGLALLLIAPVALPALAYASPPDPSWIPGVYDDADHDDVVTLATSAAGDIAPALPVDVWGNPPLVGNVLRPVQTQPHDPAPSAVHSRAPPAS